MGKRGRVDDDDAALWEKVAETAAPLKDRGRTSSNAAPPVPKAKSLPRRLQASRQVTPSPAPKPSHIPHAEALDRQTSRQLEKGRLEVEARLDLHGMRQRDAHAQLRRFLTSGQGYQPGNARMFQQ